MAAAAVDELLGLANERFAEEHFVDQPLAIGGGV